MLDGARDSRSSTWAFLLGTLLRIFRVRRSEGFEAVDVGGAGEPLRGPFGLRGAARSLKRRVGMPENAGGVEGVSP